MYGYSSKHPFLISIKVKSHEMSCFSFTELDISIYRLKFKEIILIHIKIASFAFILFLKRAYIY